jgi:hypothetical protein
MLPHCSIHKYNWTSPDVKYNDNDDDDDDDDDDKCFKLADQRKKAKFYKSNKWR